MAPICGKRQILDFPGRHVARECRRGIICSQKADMGLQKVHMLVKNKKTHLWRFLAIFQQQHHLLSPPQLTTTAHHHLLSPPPPPIDPMTTTTTTRHDHHHSTQAELFK
nr:hypothetical protein [Tanacetum cinerariifolium]